MRSYVWNRVKEWDLQQTVNLVMEETVLISEEQTEKLLSVNTIKKIHEVTNHKNAENLMWAFKCANLLNPDLRKNVNRVVADCKVCTKFKKTFARPKATLPKSTEFNQIVTLDLKFFDKTPVLWIVDSCTRFIKGVVLKNKEGPTIVKAIHENWICNFGFPSIRFWADNGTEFVNCNLSELGAKAGFKVQCGPAYSPWSNGTNERNHSSADIIVKKVMEQDRKISLDTAVAMAGWTHNSNINHSGFSPLQLVTGKSVILPGITFSSPTSLGEFDAENIKAIIMGHYTMMKEFTAAEFTKKLLQLSESRRAEYQKIRYSPGDRIYYQNLKDKAWYGPVRVVSQEGNSVFLLDRNILKKLNTCRCMPYDERLPTHKAKDDESPPEDPQTELRLEVPEEGIEVEPEEDEEQNTSEDPIARRTRSKSLSFDPNPDTIITIEKQREELRKDLVAAYYTTLPQKEDLSEGSVYRVEVPTKQHGRPDVVEAKKAEMENLRTHNTWNEVKNTGQDLIDLKWVITESEKQDGQKQKVKGRLVCKGYQETFKPQSDSPTIGRSNLLVFTAVAANNKFHLWAIDIKGAYLQSNPLDRDIFVRPPP